MEIHHDSEAVAELRRAVAISPNDATAQFELGRAFLAVGLADSAVVAFDHAVAIQGSRGMLNSAAYALALKAARLDRAEQYVRAAIDSTIAVLRDVGLDDAGPREYAAVASLGSYWDTLGWI